MAISIPQGYIVTSKEPIDKRLVLTKKQMRDVNDDLMPHVYFCICAEKEETTGKHKMYVYNKEWGWQKEPGTGRFRGFAGYYPELEGLPSINGEPILGSEDGGHYKLQNKLYAIMRDGQLSEGWISVGPGIEIDNWTWSEGHLSGIKVLFDNETIKSDSETLYVDITELFNEGDAISIDQPIGSKKASINVRFKDPIFLNDSELGIQLDSEKALELVNGKIAVKVDDKTIKFVDGKLVSFPEPLYDGVATQVRYKTSEWDSEHIDVLFHESEGLAVHDNRLFVKINDSEGLEFDPVTGEIQLKIKDSEGLDFAADGKLQVKINEIQALEFDSEGKIRLKIVESEGLAFNDDGKLFIKLNESEGLEFDDYGNIKVRIDDSTVHFNSETGKLELHLDTTKGINVDSEGNLYVVIDNNTLHFDNGVLNLHYSDSEGLGLDSEGKFFIKVDDSTIHINANGELYARSGRPGEAIGITESEGEQVTNVLYDHLTIKLDNSENELYVPLNKTKAIDVDSNGLFVKFDGDGIPVTSEDSTIVVRNGKLHVKNYVPNFFEINKKGKALRVNSEGNLEWMLVSDIDDIALKMSDVTASEGAKYQNRYYLASSESRNNIPTLTPIRYDKNTRTVYVDLSSKQNKIGEGKLVKDPSSSDIYWLNPNDIYQDYNSEAAGNTRLFMLKRDKDKLVYAPIQLTDIVVNDSEKAVKVNGQLVTYGDTVWDQANHKFVTGNYDSTHSIKGLEKVSWTGSYFDLKDRVDVNKLYYETDTAQGAGWKRADGTSVTIPTPTTTVDRKTPLVLVKSSSTPGRPNNQFDLGIRLDNNSVRVNSEGAIYSRGFVLNASEGDIGKALIAIVPSTTTSDAVFKWGEAGKVDGVDVIEGSTISRLPLERKIVKLKIGDGLDFTSEGGSEGVLLVDLYEVLPDHVITGGTIKINPNKKGKALTVNSEGHIYWEETGKVDGFDIIEDGVHKHLPNTNKILELTIDKGLDYTSESKLLVDLLEVLPNVIGKSGQVLTVSEGVTDKLIWKDVDKLQHFYINDGTTTKELPITRDAHSNVTINEYFNRGLKINSESGVSKVGHENEVVPQDRGAHKILIPVGTDRHGHIIDGTAATIANGLREVTFKEVTNNQGTYVATNDWAYVKDPNNAATTTNVGLKIAGIDNTSAATRYNNATLKIDANGLSANYKSKAQKLVSTDATSEQIIIINGNELSLNQLTLNRLQLLENAKGVIDSEGLRNNKYYPTINLLKTELDAKQDLLTDIGPIVIGSEGDSEHGHNSIYLKYDNKTIVLNNKGQLKAKDVDLPVNGELSDIVPYAASEGNPLVDEDLMYDSLSSNLGIFRGNFDSEGSLPTKAQVPALMRNDYAFITVPVYTSEGVQYFYHRYKYIDDTSETGHWEFEYRVSGSTFTKRQLDALNSMWNLQLTTRTVNHLNDRTIHITSEDRRRWNNKQEKLTASTHINATALAANQIKVDDRTSIVDATTYDSYLPTIGAVKGYFKKKQTAVDSNSSTTNSEAAYFISRITQNDQGVITPIRTEYTYNNIPNKPSINGVTLSGNKTFAQLGLAATDGVKIDTDGKTIKHTNSVVANASNNIKSFTYDAQGHVTAATNKTLSRGINDQSNVIGHSNAEITPKTTEGLAAVKYDSFGHITAGTSKTLGRGINDQSDVIGHSNTAITAKTTPGLAAITHDTYGHITASTSKTLGRGINDQSDVIGHSNSITANTTSGLKFFTYDAYGHVSGAVNKTLGNGLTDSSNVIGHSNSVTAATNVGGNTGYKVPYFSYDAQGHITSSGAKDIFPSMTSKGGYYLVVNSEGNGLQWQQLSIPASGMVGISGINGITASVSGGIATVGHSNNITANTTSGLKFFKYDAQGHVTRAVNKTLGRGIDDQSNVIGHSNSVTANTTSGLKFFKYDEYGHVTASVNKTLGRGISDRSNEIGHSNTAITANTTDNIKTFGVDTYGHVTAYTVRTLGRGIGYGSGSSANEIGHSNSITATSDVGKTGLKVPYFSYDAQGHFTGSGTKDIFPSMTGKDDTWYLAVNSAGTGLTWKQLDLPSEGIQGVTGIDGITVTGTGIATVKHTNAITAQSTKEVYNITYDAQGHITGSPTLYNPDWEQETTTESDFIKHRPAIKRDTSSSSLTPDRNTGVRLNDVTGNVASGAYSVAEGQGTKATGQNSHAEGSGTSASGGFGSHAEGLNTKASGSDSHAEGNSTTASGPCSHAEGDNTTASKQSSHAEGARTSAAAINSHAEGYRTTANAEGSHTEGGSTVTSEGASYSHAEGYQTKTIGSYSHAEGQGTIAGDGINGNDAGAHAEGVNTQAKAEASHAEGKNTTVGSWAPYGHAEGYNTIASASSAHAEGSNTKALQIASHAEGSYTEAGKTTDTGSNLGSYSHAEGFHTAARSNYQHVQGQWNVEDSDGTYADIVGWGTSSARKNLSALSTTGTLKLKENIYIKSNDNSTGGYRLVPTFWQCTAGSGSTSTGVWIKLCHLKFASHFQGRFVAMRIFMGDGNNARTNQNAYIDLTMQSSWSGDTTNIGRVGCTWLLEPLLSPFTLDNVDVQVIATSGNLEYDVWFWVGRAYCVPSYEVFYEANNVTLIHDGVTTVVAEKTVIPTSGSGVPCNIAGKMVSSGGTTYNTIGYNNSATHKQTGLYQNSFQADLYGNYKDDLITNQWLALWDGSWGTITSLTTIPTAHGSSNLQIASGGRIVTTGGNETYAVGSGVNPVYAVRISSTSNAVKLVASTSTVGSNTAGAQVPVYLNAGTITAMNTTTGGYFEPVFINSGKITKSYLPTYATLTNTSSSADSPNTYLGGSTNNDNYDTTNVGDWRQITGLSAGIINDPGSSFTVSGTGITIKTAGVYEVSGSVYYRMSSENASAGSISWIGAYIMIGDDHSRELTSQRITFGNQTEPEGYSRGIKQFTGGISAGTKIVGLSAGQKVTLWARGSARRSARVGIHFNNPATYLCIKRLK